MKKIDRETVQKILDTADIVEVVSDFVHLKRRGAGYIGLCPFHNERTPSFSVSKAKGICKCFSCGKGGSPVNFIMEHEQLSYYEALRYLAKKYNIEIQEHEMSDKEREEATERESMLAVNDFALQHFEHNLLETDDGRAIGLSYFQERGINELSIKRFHLGYSLEQHDDLIKTARAKGYQDKYLIDTGLCIKREDNEKIYDRFKGRVMYPIFSISGKVVAFGGRTLRSDKEVAKYVNSPESIIYQKSHELYGLYQAKQAIVKKDKCILVEGYMDVISMYQSGVENVVASSGTSLTEGQIRLIHRFTENVTVIYDSDAAGIKASLRGIDMLLAEGLNVKVLLLPEGEDPDSFAQSHSSSELEEYLATHETDFMRFKTSVLLQGIENDPIQRSHAISDIVRSISVIPNDITRAIYIKDCSRMLDINERVLTLQVAKMKAERAENEKTRTQQKKAEQSLPQSQKVDQSDDTTTATETIELLPTNETAHYLAPYEREVLRYVLKYGMLDIGEIADETRKTIKVIEYIDRELKNEEMDFLNHDYKITYEEALRVSTDTWQTDYDHHVKLLTEKFNQEKLKGEQEIRDSGIDSSDIEKREKALIEKCKKEYNQALADFCVLYLERIMTSSPNNIVRQITTDLVSEKYVLSKVYTKYSKIETEQERLPDLIPRALDEWKNAILECRIRGVRKRLQDASSDTNPDMAEIDKLMAEIDGLHQLKKKFAKRLGERIIPPRK